jgi:hypothetical protein
VASPGFTEDGYEYYTLGGAECLRDALPAFQGGEIVISVLGLLRLPGIWQFRPSEEPARLVSPWRTGGASGREPPRTFG